MRLGRVRRDDGSVALVAAVGDGAQLLDLSAAMAARNAGADDASADPMLTLIEAGRPGLEQAWDALEWAQREGEASWYGDADRADWLTPVPPRPCIAAGRNFRDHLTESVDASDTGRHSDFPTGFVKLPQTLAPHRAKVRRPVDVEALDYEIELTAVIGRSVERVRPQNALDAVFGYTIMNDLSAREWQFREMANNLLLVGKNFPGSGPVGPWILTADEAPDPAAFRLELTVNGEVRQSAGCGGMIFGIAELVAFWSRIGLAPGDLIASGTPEGVAHFRDDPAPFYLKPGDRVAASIDRIGTLETFIV